jgi:hypothetical protein
VVVGADWEGRQEAGISGTDGVWAAMEDAVRKVRAVEEEEYRKYVLTDINEAE